MRAVVMNAFREPMELAELPDPACPPDGVILETAACGICRSDWHTWIGAATASGASRATIRSATIPFSPAS
jgi:D-arabinose 1-dehydrogenase-like Zn-dependent alcohol dehydrogenase